MGREIRAWKQESFAVSNSIFEIMSAALLKPETIHALGDPSRALPEDIADLLEVATGHAQVPHEALPANLRDCTHDELHDHILHFLEQVLLVEGADDYRVLGLFADATQEEINRHFQLLMQLFFTDTETRSEMWNEETAVRINRAYSVLREPEKRRAYDQKLIAKGRQLHKLGVRRKIRTAVPVTEVADSPSVGAKADAPFLAKRIDKVHEDETKVSRRATGEHREEVAASLAGTARPAAGSDMNPAGHADDTHHGHPFGSFLDTHFSRADSNLSETELRRVRREPNWNHRSSGRPKSRTSLAEAIEALPDLDQPQQERQLTEKAHRLTMVAAVLVFVVVVGAVSYLVFGPLDDSSLQQLNVFGRQSGDQAVPADSRNTGGPEPESAARLEAARPRASEPEPALVVVGEDSKPAKVTAAQPEEVPRIVTAPPVTAVSEAPEKAVIPPKEAMPAPSEEVQPSQQTIVVAENVAANEAGAGKDLAASPPNTLHAEVTADLAPGSMEPSAVPEKTDGNTVPEPVPAGAGIPSDAGSSLGEAIDVSQAVSSPAELQPDSTTAQQALETDVQMADMAPDKQNQPEQPPVEGLNSSSESISSPVPSAVAETIPSTAPPVPESSADLSDTVPSEMPLPGPAAQPALAMVERRQPSEPVAEPPPFRVPLSEDALLRVLSKFRVAYKQGDLPTLMSLFTEDARTNDQHDRPGIRKDYAELFRMTARRQIFFRDLVWQTSGDKAVGRGKFEVWIYPKGGQPLQTYFGQLALELVRHDNELLIKRFIHSYE